MLHDGFAPIGAVNLFAPYHSRQYLDYKEGKQIDAQRAVDRGTERYKREKQEESKIHLHHVYPRDARMVVVQSFSGPPKVIPEIEPICFLLPFHISISRERTTSGRPEARQSQEKSECGVSSRACNHRKATSCRSSANEVPNPNGVPARLTRTKAGQPQTANRISGEPAPTRKMPPPFRSRIEICR